MLLQADTVLMRAPSRMDNMGHVAPRNTSYAIEDLIFSIPVCCRRIPKRFVQPCAVLQISVSPRQENRTRLPFR